MSLFKCLWCLETLYWESPRIGTYLDSPGTIDGCCSNTPHQIVFPWWHEWEFIGGSYFITNKGQLDRLMEQLLVTNSNKI